MGFHKTKTGRSAGGVPERVLWTETERTAMQECLEQKRSFILRGRFVLTDGLGVRRLPEKRNHQNHQTQKNQKNREDRTDRVASDSS
jgi:hypothetical protein